MPLENFSISRICLHEVHRKPDDGPNLRPSYGTGLLTLPPEALAAFRARIINAFRGSAQCMDMTVRDFGPGSVLHSGAALMDLNDASYVNASCAFADALATSQGSRAIPGGLMVVFQGRVGNPAMPYFGLMKAELHEGFLKTRTLQAQYVSDLFLSPKTKLYKIGLFISDGAAPRPALPNGWQATVYDSAMTASQRDNAATYFHSKFLGLDVPANAAHQVKRFFVETKSFIRQADIPEEQKVDLYNSLYSYLKVNRSPTIQVSQFAADYLEDDLADEYEDRMRAMRFPLTAIAKDLSEVTGALRLRKFKFPGAITLSGPPEAVKDLVTVEAINGDGGANWTQITIRGAIENQE